MGLLGPRDDGVPRGGHRRRQPLGEQPVQQDAGAGPPRPVLAAPGRRHHLLEQRRRVLPRCHLARRELHHRGAEARRRGEDPGALGRQRPHALRRPTRLIPTRLVPPDATTPASPHLLRGRASSCPARGLRR
ncbi:hypothetical protein ABID70_000082 [Clavibacter michiganensis]